MANNRFAFFGRPDRQGGQFGGFFGQPQPARFGGGGGLSGLFFRQQQRNLQNGERQKPQDNAATSAQAIFAAAAEGGRAARRRVGQRFGRAETILSALLGAGSPGATRKTLLGA